MYTRTPPVQHCDLSENNIFVHFEDNSVEPSFVIGDFGLSEIRKPAPENSGWPVYERPTNGDVKDLHGHVFRAFLTGAQPEMVPSIDTPEHVDILYQVIDLLNAIRANDAETRVFPDLTPIIALAASAPPANGDEAALRSFRDTFVPANTPAVFTPALATSREEAMAVRGIHGPWHLAKVDVSNGLARPVVLEVDPTPHHRPNTKDSASDTGTGTEPGSSDPESGGSPSHGSEFTNNAFDFSNMNVDTSGLQESVDSSGARGANTQEPQPGLDKETAQEGETGQGDSNLDLQMDYTVNPVRGPNYTIYKALPLR